jgi:hypothetical protein
MQECILTRVARYMTLTGCGGLQAGKRAGESRVRWCLVEIRSLDDLREVDERTLSFSPFGLGGKMAAQDAARFQQEAVSHPELAPSVPQRVRDCINRLRVTHAYGVLCYDFFTIAHDQAQLALEFALRERFVELQGGTAHFRDAAGNVHEIATSPFKDLQAEVRRREDDEWRLTVRRTGGSIRFDGMLDSLLRWAREEGLLRGQMNRARGRVVRDMRDHVAHGAGDHLLMPVNSARAISDVVETVNQLWGAATPGGRLYPAPVRREVQLVGWSPRGDIMVGVTGPYPGERPPDPEAAAGPVQVSVPGEGPADDWTWVLVRAVPHDEGLMRFDSLFEVTEYPCEMLWGPGNATDAAIWAARERPMGDTVEVLDRLFLVQYHGDRLYLPRRPEIALGLPDSERAGTWSLLRADNPTAAFAHARNVVMGGTGCSRRGSCQQCAAETLRRGAWREVADTLAAQCPQCQPVTVPDARVTSAFRWPRYQQILGQGSWTLGDELRADKHWARR